MFTVQELSDRIEIDDVVARMAWCQDRRDWDGLDRVLAVKLDVDYTSSDNVAPVSVDRADIVASWRDALERVDASQHVLTGLQTQVDGDAAQVRLNELVWLTRSSAEGSSLYSFGTTMHLRLRRFTPGWLIASLSVRGSWADGNASVLGQYAFEKQ